MPETSTHTIGNGGNPGDFIRDAIGGLTVGPPTTFKKLTVFPLLKASPVTPALYLTLEEAISEGVLKVTELSHAGSVPELHVINRSDRPVFLLDGEELIGAKQNRIVNLDILVPERTELNIPVSCVEAGRWTYRSPAFSSSPQGLHASARAGHLSRVGRSMRGGSRSDDQSAVWADVDEQSVLMAVSSPTHAMSDIYDQYATSIDEYVKAFDVSDDQVGALFGIGPRIYGFDLFDSPSTMRAYREKLVRSYALEAIGKRNVADEAPTVESAQQLLDSTAQAASETYPALGLGVDVRLHEEKREELVGAGLAWREHMVHLNAFTDATAKRAQRTRWRWPDRS